METLLVSVIIPTYQRPHFLSRAVDSVLAQSYSNLEIIVVDDNAAYPQARKKTAALMRAYENDPRVHYLQAQTPLGGGPARNMGIEAATGSYIAFLDDDDRYLPDRIAHQLRFVTENGLDASFSDLYLFDEHERPVEHRCYPFVTDCSNDALFRQHILHSLGQTNTVMVKREVLREIGGFPDVPMGQDFMLVWRLIEHQAKIGYLHDAQVVMYLHNGERISVGDNKIRGENRLYKLKQAHFDLLTHRERRYVRFRHYAVLSVSCKRSGRPLPALYYGIRAVCVSPLFFVREVRDRRLYLKQGKA